MAKILYIFMIALSLSACDDASKVYEDTKKTTSEAYDIAKKTTLETYENAKKKTSEVYEDAKQKTIQASNSAVQQINKVGDTVTDYTNQQVDSVVNAIKLWVYNSLEPTFPWLFLISFLLFFGALKMVIPFSNYVAIQVPILIGSYAVVFYLFYTMDLTSFALEATFWFVTPIVGFSVLLYLLRGKLLPKINSLNERVFSTETEPEKLDSVINN